MDESVGRDASLPDTVQMREARLMEMCAELSRKWDDLSTEYTMSLLHEVTTEKESTAVVRRKDAEIHQLKAERNRVRRGIRLILEESDDREVTSDSRDMKGTSTVNMVNVSLNQIDPLERQECKVRHQISQARVTKAEGVQSVESQSWIPDEPKVDMVARQGEKKSAGTPTDLKDGDAWLCIGYEWSGVTVCRRKECRERC